MVINKACPLLAPMAEEGWTNNEIARLTIKEYLKNITDKDIDALILGCTHYPLFEDVIKQEIGNEIEIINTGKMVAEYTKRLLIKANMQNEECIDNYEIFLTDVECNFINVANKLIKGELIINRADI